MGFKQEAGPQHPHWADASFRWANQPADIAASTTAMLSGPFSPPPTKTPTVESKLGNTKWGEQEHVEKSVQWDGGKKRGPAGMAQVFQ